MTTSDYLAQLQTDKQNLINNLETKGITGLTGDETFTELVPEVLNINGGTIESVEPKDVNFYDWEGTRLYSYTKAEFLELEDLPIVPARNGLTSQGWNWLFTNAKSHVSKYDKLNIGAIYTTDNGATRIYVELQEGRLSPMLGFAINGTATVDWGDNTTNTVTGTSNSQIIYTQHNYLYPGNYIISISSTSNIFFIGTSSGASTVLVKSTSATANENAVYLNSIKKIELGTNVLSISNYAFTNCRNLQYISMSNAVTNIGGSSFQACESLKIIVIPRFVNSIGASNIGCTFLWCYALNRVVLSQGANGMLGFSGGSMFQYCYTLTDITMPEAIVFYGGNGAFAYCYGLSYMIIPSTIDYIPQWWCQWCCGVKYYDFSHHNGVIALNYTDAFEGIPSDGKIIVPDDLYSTWITTTGWSTYASNIIKKSDWDNL